MSAFRDGCTFNKSVTSILLAIGKVYKNAGIGGMDYEKLEKKADVLYERIP